MNNHENCEFDPIETEKGIQKRLQYADELFEFFKLKNMNVSDCLDTITFFLASLNIDESHIINIHVLWEILSHNLVKYEKNK